MLYRDAITTDTCGNNCNCSIVIVLNDRHSWDCTSDYTLNGMDKVEVMMLLIQIEHVIAKQMPVLETAICFYIRFS